MTITIEQQITCARREIAMRKRVYPRWVEQSKMKQATADHELAAMEAILATLLAYQVASNPQGSML